MRAQESLEVERNASSLPTNEQHPAPIKEDAGALEQLPKAHQESTHPRGVALVTELSNQEQDARHNKRPLRCHGSKRRNGEKKYGYVINSGDRSSTNNNNEDYGQQKIITTGMMMKQATTDIFHTL